MATVHIDLKRPIRRAFHTTEFLLNAAKYGCNEDVVEAADLITEICGLSSARIELIDRAEKEALNFEEVESDLRANEEALDKLRDQAAELYYRLTLVV